MQQFIPHIWAESMLASLSRQLVIGQEEREAWQRQHEQRLREDATYALHWAELEAESYWNALYDNAYPQEEDEEW